MTTKIISNENGKLIMQVEIDINANSMLKSEEQIQASLNELGCLATKQALAEFDTDGRKIEIKGEQLTSKGQSKKKSKPPMGR